MTRINRVNLSVFVQHYFLSGLPKKIAKQDFLGKGDDGFNMVKAGGNAHALQTKNHQRRSRLRKCSFTAFSSSDNFIDTLIEGGRWLPSTFSTNIRRLRV